MTNFVDLDALGRIKAALGECKISIEPNGVVIEYKCAKLVADLLASVKAYNAQFIEASADNGSLIVRFMLTGAKTISETSAQRNYKPREIKKSMPIDSCPKCKKPGRLFVARSVTALKVDGKPDVINVRHDGSIRHAVTTYYKNLGYTVDAIAQKIADYNKEVTEAPKVGPKIEIADELPINEGETAARYAPSETKTNV